MDWGFIFQVTLATLGVASIVGGIVAYRGSVRTAVRSFAAAGIASGVNEALQSHVSLEAMVPVVDHALS